IGKVQIVDDYGDQAARTGIKDGSPLKLLNITTKADRSLGYVSQMSGGAGNNNRYEGSFSGTRINANKNITVGGIINNTINGIPEIGYDEGIGQNPLRDNSGIFSGSGGSTNQKDAKFTYRDQWSKNVQVNANYSYNSTNIESVNESRSQDFSTHGTTFSVNNDNGD